MSQEPLYTVRDSAGAIYGPANIATLQQWIGEGRITAQMQVAPQGTQDFTPAADLPALSAAFTAPTALAQYPVSIATNPYAQNTAAVQYNTVYPRSSGTAMTSLICGIAAFPFPCALLAIVAIITGHIARGQIRREPERYEGHGMATAGMILGYIQIGITLLVVAIYVLMMLFFVGAVAAGAK